MTEASILSTNEIAQSLGILKIPATVNKSVSREAELMILNVIDNAKLLMITSKRNKLTVNDINESLKMMNIEPLYGYKSWKNEVHHSTIRYTQFLDIKYLKDEQIQTTDISSRSLLAYPLQVTFDCNWLVDNHSKILLKKKGKTKNSSESKNKNYEIDHPSKKLKFYYETSIEGFFYGGVVYEMMLAKMVSDEGVGPLLTYYLDFIENILENPKHEFDQIRKIIKLAKILVINDSFNTITCQDRIVSISFTILLLPAKNIPFDQNNILMRDECSELFQLFCEKFSPFNIHIRAQIGERFIELLNDETTDCYSAYGIISSFVSLGLQTIKYVLFPNIVMILENIQNDYFYQGPERHLVFDSLVKIIGNGLYRDLFSMHMHNNLQLNASTQELYDQLMGVVGLDMMKFTYDSDSYEFI
ncbi:hypothetical protein TRFO_10379 [Tritrichomonas foetus]|uniref:TATA box binding protein associated factor (TAF) histone-like fold domain-containing protein n=1 Tax=Tritrichomonas foetus TaxID=1144522 RepID=A0A1J4J9A6_9EUKA|nr:hypothetical protein TRFO_10379 [Tritrichomonas foetus]|eukprot:OHS95728.1 hypothetical protein TRFO_10379 [Tritrichomonas foetus]